MNLIKFTLILFFTAGSAKAEESVKFISVDACKVWFKSNPLSGKTEVTYCTADKIMTLAEACAATKMSEYLTSNKMKSVSELTNSQQISLTNKYKYECQLSAQKDQAASQAIAQQQQAASQSRAMAAAAAAGVAAVASSPSLQNAQTGLALAQAGLKISENVEAKIAQAGKTGDSTSGPSKAVDSSSVPSSSSTVSSAPSRAELGGSNNETLKDSLQKFEQTTANSGTTATAPSSVETAATLKPEALAADQNAVATAKSSLVAEGSEVTAATGPSTQSAVNQLASAPSDPSTVTTPADSALAASAKSADSIFTSGLANGRTHTEPSLRYDGISPDFTFTSAAVNKFNTAAKNYISTPKATCAAAAAKANYLCVEGTSPGAIAAKEVMNSAGPILSIITSAQKTCSSTAKVSKFVNSGLLIAKGICVAAKLYCDSSCGAAATNLKTLNTSLAEIKSALQSDTVSAQEYCASLTSGYVECAKRVSERATQISAAITELKGVLAKEEAPTLGTSPGLVVACGKMAKDIALFGVQVASTWAAQQSAQSCADKLATTGAGGMAVTTQQYCEKVENASSQLCVCQKNAMAPNCPGAVLNNTGTNTNTASNDKGANIKSAGGASAFAGGFIAAPNKNKLGEAKADLAKGASAVAGTGSGSGAEGVGSGGGGTSGAGGSGGSGSGTVGSASDAGSGSAGLAEEKKKWSFGSFSGFGGFGGGSGSSGSSAGGAVGKVGSLTTKAKLDRQIASEKFSAEVSTASGKSNWEKIRNMYLIKEGSFILGQ